MHNIKNQIKVTQAIVHWLFCRLPHLVQLRFDLSHKVTIYHTMVSYGLGLLPVIRHLSQKHPNGHQLRYANDGAVAAKYSVL